ncbi:uncharacterized protein Z518_05685 [Rhinocladiella mackenziei CBS 650.93]|uniref:Rhinocladiella mackenziei CBS 650.93 unplaced genomic scaffold supercont1.4, whole genome shotgun sequence n=1 Tax=Rhinocladiella mackenziei CBS 650.93 TaxID=1442369 RepID=A0A0D2IG98_9EURO|nr:uncharacterized protein Z518_05685 [Rhinocladiella mackenziei CBS 650.93]KIX04814.1 hypothetical protein Z518_05685 [Rhinocladiella mackenziei CBS 650.93]
MAEEAVIFPSEPLFMIDRGWERRKKTTRRNSPSRGIRTQLARVPEVTITVAKGSSAAKSTSTRRTRNSKTAKSSAEESTKLQFLNYEPSKEEKKQLSQQKKPRRLSDKKISKLQGPRSSPPVDAGTEPQENRNLSPTLLKTMPGATAPLYNVIDPETKAFQSLLSYYPTRIGAAMFPIGKRGSSSHNSVLLCPPPCIHLSRLQFKDSDLLMKIILDRLNPRLNDGKPSDATIGAVSCLALCENQRGNHSKWAMHAAGMSQMIRVRGGVSSIPEAMRMKIYRADIISAVDTLSTPHLPRPAWTSTSLYQGVSLNASPNQSLILMLVHVELAPTLFDVFLDPSYLCQALEHAASTMSQSTLLHMTKTLFVFNTTC